MEDQEKIFRKVASENAESIDFERLWEQLEPHVPQKKRRRPIVLFWMVAGLVLLFSFVGYYFTKVSENRISNSIENHSKPTTISANNPNLESEADKSNISHIERQNLISNNSKTDQKVSSTNIPSSTKLSKGKSSIEVVQENVGLTHDLPKSSVEIATNTNANINMYIDNLDQKSELNMGQMNETLNSEVNSGITQLEEELRNLEDISPLVIKEMGEWQKLKCAKSFTTPRIQKSKKPLYVSMSIGAGTFDIARISSIKTNEKPLEMICGQISSPIIHWNKWSVEPGLRYQRMTTRLSHIGNTYQSTTTQGINEIIIDNAGKATNIVGDVSGQITKNISTKWHTYHNILDLPIMVNYKMLNSHHHAIGMSFGPAITIGYWGEGAYLDAENALIKYSSNVNPYQFSTLSMEFISLMAMEVL